LTVAGLRELLRRLKEKGVVGTGSFAFPSDKVTSANLQAFFQANAISKLSVLSEFADCFVKKAADVVVTYTWSTDLEMLLPEALTLYEEKAGFAQAPTYWIDILFNDQNAKDIQHELDQAEHVYRTAQYHVVVLANNTLWRCWCLFEIATRAEAVRLHGASPSVFVALPPPPGLSYSKQVGRYGMSGPGDFYIKDSNWFLAMQSYSATDRRAVQQRCIEMMGSADQFNATVKVEVQRALAETEAKNDSLREYMTTMLHGHPQEHDYDFRGRFMLRQDAIEPMRPCDPFPADMTFKDDGTNTGRCLICGRGKVMHPEDGGGHCFYPDPLPTTGAAGEAD
jgi:hypothetical protein